MRKNKIKRWLPLGIIMPILLALLINYFLAAKADYKPQTDDPAVIYHEACSKCHGENGEGGGAMISQFRLEGKSAQEIKDTIRSGSFIMPAFTAIRQDTLDRLADYLLQGKFSK